MKDTECDIDRSRLSRLATVVALIGCALWLGGAAGVAHGARADTTLTPSQLDRLHTITEWDITYTETRTWTGTGSRTRHGFGFAGPQTETDSHTYLDTWNTTARYTVGSPTGQECVWFRSCTPNLDRPLSVEHTHILRDRHQSIFTGGCPFGASGTAVYQRDLNTSVVAGSSDLTASNFPGGQAGFQIIPVAGGAIASGTLDLPATTFPGKDVVSLTSCFHPSISRAGPATETPEIWQPPTNGNNEVRIAGGRFYVSGSEETHWPPFSGGCVEGFCGYQEFPLVGADFMISRVDTIRWSAREHVDPGLELAALEVNQSIQDLRGSVPLTEGKTTYVRAFPIYHGAAGTKNVTLELVGTRAGVALPGSPLRPINGERLAGAYYGRQNLSQSANFRLPPEWTHGEVVLKVRALGDDTGVDLACREAAGTPDDCSYTATFEPVGQLQVRFVGVPWTDTESGTTYAAPDYQAAQDEAQRLKAILPTARVDWDYVPGTPASTALTRDGVRPMWNTIKAELAVQKLRDGCYATCHRVYLAMLTNPAGMTLGGSADAIPGIVAAFGHTPDSSAARETAAHELGHILGRHHTVDSALGLTTDGYKQGFCGETASPLAPDWLDTIAVGGATYPAITPAAGGGDGRIFGFDTVSADADPTRLAGPVDPTGHFELMSYCDGYNYSRAWNWISPGTYAAARAWLNADFAPPTVWSFARATVATDYLIVRGQVDTATGAVRFDPFTRITSTTALDTPPSGPYSVELRDASGAVISTTAFDAVPAHVDGADGPGGRTTATFLVPIPDTGAVAQVVLVKSGHDLGAIARSDNAPTIHLLSPTASTRVTGSLDVHWSAADADGDPLHVTIGVSPDGGTTWRTVGVDVTGTSYTIDESGLGASSNAIVRVEASDGFRTATDTSDTFTIAGHAPVVTVASPGVGKRYEVDESIVLAASAFSLDEGALGPGTLSWSIDGRPSSGSAEMIVAAVDLGLGSHTATVTAVDSSGRSTSKRVLFSVGAATEPSSGNAPTGAATSNGNSDAALPGDHPTATPTVTPTTPRGVPQLQTRGGAFAPQLQSIGGHPALAASVTVDRPAVLRVSIPTRMILRGSIIGGVRSGRDRSTLVHTVTASGGVAFRLRITKTAAAHGPLVVRIVATGADGGTSTLRVVFHR